MTSIQNNSKSLRFEEMLQELANPKIGDLEQFIKQATQLLVRLERNNDHYRVVLTVC